LCRNRAILQDDDMDIFSADIDPGNDHPFLSYHPFAFVTVASRHIPSFILALF
jgi:hypothetical protein